LLSIQLSEFHGERDLADYGEIEQREKDKGEFRVGGEIEIAVTMNNLAVLLTHLGEYERACELLRESVSIRESVYGAEHVLTRCARENLDYVEKKRESMRELERDFEKERGRDTQEERDRESERERDVDEGEMDDVESLEEGRNERRMRRARERERERENERIQREQAQYERSAGDVLRDAPPPQHPSSSVLSPSISLSVCDSSTNTEERDREIERHKDDNGEEREKGRESERAVWQEFQDEESAKKEKVVKEEGNDVFVDAPGDISVASL
jgi:hypothetical protein